MSKMFKIYTDLKKQDSHTVYLFKSGIFFIAIDNDAYVLSDIFHFKLGNLNHKIVKCGFPCNSLGKYIKLFRLYNSNAKIVEPEQATLYDFNAYRQNEYIIELLKLINSVDVNSLSISEAYKFIEDLKLIVSNADNSVL